MLCIKCETKLKLMEVVIVGYDEITYEEIEQAIYYCPECGEIHKKEY